MKDRRERFAQEYIKDLNATKAAIRAGYAKTTAHCQGSRLLKNGKVQARIADLKAKVESKIVYDKARVLDEIARIALCDIKDAFTEDGALKPIHEIPENVRRAIGGVQVDEARAALGDRGEQLVAQVKRVKFWNKHDALVTLAKYFRILEEKSSETDEGKVSEFMAFMRERRGGK
jgi:phage terminase small subunit